MGDNVLKIAKKWDILFRIASEIWWDYDRETRRHIYALSDK